MPIYLSIFLLIFSTHAVAQDAITLSAVRFSQEDHGSPSITFHSHVHGSIQVRLSCGKRSYALQSQIEPDQDHLILLENLNRGTHRCTGSLALTASDGSTGEMPISLEVQVLESLKLTVQAESLDLKANRLVVNASRPLSRAKVEVFGLAPTPLGSGEVAVGGQTQTEMEWSQQAGEVLKLVLTGFDMQDLPGQLVLSPWSYDIPHEDLIFATGSADISDQEAVKLENAWTELNQVMAKYGSIVEVQLYIAGYTDTVGDRASNLALSLRRARSIATWFRRRGFQGSTHYQGFGEAALAVATPDETDEPKNRRSLYILAAQAPALSTEIPNSNWNRLP